jgi:hypothetical protein
MITAMRPGVILAVSFFAVETGTGNAVNAASRADQVSVLQTEKHG